MALNVLPSDQTVPYEVGAGTPPAEGDMFRLEKIHEKVMVIVLVLDVLLLRFRHQKSF